MKDFLLKILVVTIISIFESTVSLPVLFLVIFLSWSDLEVNYSLAWLAYCSLILGVMWGFSWWLGAIFLLVVSYIYQYLEKYIFNRMLRLISILMPGVLVLAVVLNVDFSWRIIVYGGLSLIIVFVLQKFLLTDYKKKYL
ncbi:MAG: hypothetical protein GW942_02680 [Candidatus Pacebacteria bacterium]|nr:hypothetical protein [Candidatus Paceibacterota bacterium]